MVFLNTVEGVKKALLAGPRGDFKTKLEHVAVAENTTLEHTTVAESGRKGESCGV